MNLLAADFRSRVWLVVVSELLRTLLVSGVLALLFYLVLAGPLVSIANQIRKRKVGEGVDALIQVPPKHSGDELGMLLSSFNTLVVEREKASQYLLPFWTLPPFH